jgi:hypothetical protein
MIDAAVNERQRTTLAALLGTAETLATARHELIVALVADPERLDGVSDGQLVAVANAALALDAAIIAALHGVSSETAEMTALVADFARNGVDGRLSEERGG